MAKPDAKEVLLEKTGGVARISINRPQKLNAFTLRTLEEIVDAMHEAWFDKEVGVVVLTGVGDRGFCVGSDISARTGEVEEQTTRMGLFELHSQVLHMIRNMPKPVIARVNGYAIGGGHVFALLCDLTIASSTAMFGQVGPRVGSYDAGFGAAYLARVVGEKKAREIWYLCRRYTAEQALQMGLVNVVVPPEDLDKEVDQWCREILEKSPTAIALMKSGFNADTDQVWGIERMQKHSLHMYYESAEAAEGRHAFEQKRKPEFGKFRRVSY
jgi:dihydroxynaphthoic acid synthetase